jgi:3'-5' exonuclease
MGLKDECNLPLLIILQISVIKASSVIGVSFEGVLMGRFGELCWVNFSDGENTFLFDVKAIGLHECLVNVLLDKDVTKVVHDVRLPADCLLNKHKISMLNVIDTQVLFWFGLYKLFTLWVCL